MFHSTFNVLELFLLAQKGMLAGNNKISVFLRDAHQEQLLQKQTFLLLFSKFFLKFHLKLRHLFHLFTFTKYQFIDRVKLECYILKRSGKMKEWFRVVI